MKRIALIAAAFCLMMIATVGAGVVTAKQDVKPNQAGKSSIYLYNVAPPIDEAGSGRLMINLDKHTFVFNGKGFDPNTPYVLRYWTASSGIHVFASGKTTPSGNLHITGTWARDAPLPGALGFGVGVYSSFTATFEAVGSCGGEYYYILSDGAIFFGAPYSQSSSLVGSTGTFTPSGLVGPGPCGGQSASEMNVTVNGRTFSGLYSIFPPS